MLKINENSYVSTDEANEYINEMYTRTSPLRVFWSILNVEEKESYLLQATAQIEKLLFIGRKYLYNQKMAFPRITGAYGSLIDYRYNSGNEAFQVPAEVKQAEIENALGIILEKIKSVSDKQFLTLQSLGAVKNTKYNKREAGDLGFGAELTGGTVKACPIASPKAYALLRNRIGGGYVC